MRCKLCGKDTAEAKYDRVDDRFYVGCTNCGGYVAYIHLRSKAEVIEAYESSYDKKKAKR